MSESERQQVYIRLADNDTSFLCTVTYQGFGLAPQATSTICDQPSAEQEHPMTIIPATIPSIFADPSLQLERDRWLSKFAGVLREINPTPEHANR